MHAKTSFSRLAAYEVLKKIEEQSAYANLILKNLPDHYVLSPQDIAFVRLLVQGVLETKRSLDFVLAKLVKKTPDPICMRLLRIGAYQLLYTDVPPSAACNETVRAANKAASGRSGFINGVLRNLARQKEDLLSALEKTPAPIRLSVSDSIYKLLEKQYPGKAEAIISAFSAKQPLYIRVNTLRTTADELFEEGMVKVSENSIIAEGDYAHLVRQIPAGNFYIQGPGSQKAVRLLDAKPGETIIDVCACPGGKSLGAAIDMQDQGRVYSFDLHASKLPLITESAKRLGITIIRTEQFDATGAKKDLVGKADGVICDVPCSGLGVIGAKPEIRYKETADFKELYTLQKKIIRSAATYLKPGGRMIYSTCTLNQAENQQIVAGFLTENQNFSLQEEHTLLPDTSGEGFYIALLKNENRG